MAAVCGAASGCFGELQVIVLLFGSCEWLGKEGHQGVPTCKSSGIALCGSGML